MDPPTAHTKTETENETGTETNTGKDVTEVTDVIIIGAGAAGIGAATKLTALNIPYIVLQARDRIGGRVCTDVLDGVPIDLGASWTHFYSPENPLYPYIAKFQSVQLKMPRDKQDFYIDAEAEQAKQESCEYSQKEVQAAFEWVEQYCKAGLEKCGNGADMSLGESTKEFMQEFVRVHTARQKRCLQVMLSMKQAYQGSSVQQLSTFSNQFSIFDFDQGHNYLHTLGYGHLLTQIANQIQLNKSLKLQQIVTSVTYGKDGVTVQCLNGRVYKGKKVICSLPLNLLKMGKVGFVPQLPMRCRQAIERLGVALLDKILVIFQQCFWNNTQWLNIASSQHKFTPIYNHPNPTKNILCCFLSNQTALHYQSLSDEQIIQQLVAHLKKAFKSKADKIKVREFKVTRWNAEEFSRGSYSAFHVGAGWGDCGELRKAIDDVLWFVGEHCYWECLGTVHGAFRTGEMAAEQIGELLGGK